MLRTSGYPTFSLAIALSLAAIGSAAAPAAAYTSMQSSQEAAGRRPVVDGWPPARGHASVETTMYRPPSKKRPH